jgi:hypothetical protein
MIISPIGKIYLMNTNTNIIFTFWQSVFCFYTDYRVIRRDHMNS